MKKIFFIVHGVIFINTSIAQNVGIGTTTPLEKLSVVSVSGHGISHESSAIKLSTYIDWNGGYFDTASHNPFHLYPNNGAAQFTLLQNGNVSIGSTNPQFKLDIKGRMKIQTGTIGNIFTTPGIWFHNSTGENLKVNLFLGDHIGIATAMANVSSSGTPGNTVYTDNTITNALIDNTSECCYVVANSSTGTWTDFNLRVTRIQINYSITGPD